MKKFFSDVFLCESAIFTLWGSKPMTHIPVTYSSQEEADEAFNSLPPEEQQLFVTCFYDLDDNWANWEKVSSRFPMKEYLFFEREDRKDVKIKDVYFVNILNTALSLEENYELFKRIGGADFDPLSIVFDLQDKSSLFWDRILSNSTCLGVLFGFGKKNALCFQWKHLDDHSEEAESYIENLPFTFSDNPPLESCSLTDFPIPVFASFPVGLKDEVVEKYRKEREEIKKIYKGQNFVDLILKKLTS